MLDKQRTTRSLPVLIKALTFATAIGHLFASAQCALADPDEERLVFAAVLYRHGDRTPIDPYPADPYKSPDFWNHTHWGHLTNLGKMQHFELGQWLKSRYHKRLVNDTYDMDEILIRSTNVDRALMSAQANLAGFYPPEDFDVWDPKIPWQPIPVHTTPEKEDKLIYMGAKCPRYDYLYRKYMESDAHKELKKKYKWVFEYLTKHTNKTVNSFKTAQQIWGVLVIEDIHQMRLPNWTAKVFPDPLTEISAIAFQTATVLPGMARLQSGPLLKDILKGFQSKIEEKLKPDRGLWIYSAHDTTVADLLNTLRVFSPPHNPPFTATVMLELYVKGGNAYVKLFYKRGVNDHTGQQIEIPMCGTPCLLSKMFELYEDVIPDNWDDECQLQTMTITYEDAQIGSEFVPVQMIPATLFLFSTLLLLFIIVTIIVYRRRRLHENDRWYLQMNN